MLVKLVNTMETLLISKGGSHPKINKDLQEDKTILNDLTEGNNKCAENCQYWSRCGGASPSNKYYENGSFDSAETTHCRCMIQMPMDIVLGDIEKQFGVA